LTQNKEFSVDFAAVRPFGHCADGRPPCHCAAACPPCPCPDASPVGGFRWINDSILYDGEIINLSDADLMYGDKWRRDAASALATDAADAAADVVGLRIHPVVFDTVT
jgi:hypothetical protein